MVLFLDANSSVHHYEYYLGGHFVEIDEHGHLAVIIGVDHLVFYDIDGHLLEPLGVSKHQSWKPLVLMRFLDQLKKGVLLKVFLVLTDPRKDCFLRNSGG